jgi:ABC-type bacteriocin/lantibiotic exporter with double-glycine peptidase domain
VWVGSVAVVDQDIFNFEGTVRENLRLWNDEVPMHQVVAAARDACLLDEIAARSGNFDALVAEGGTNWSGGQLQRMEIARALSSCPTVLVLDEATSSLDPETEAQIIQNVRNRGCTCLVIAHRLSTIRDMDEIIVLEGGEIVQRGTHTELMSSQGPYVNLVMVE